MEVGVLGGTFDPIHIGHLIVAEEARTRLKLDQVIFLPAGQPWMKEGQTITSSERRYRMVELATESNLYFRPARYEIDRPGTTYTAETLEQFRQDFGNSPDIYFILGLDALEHFHQWKEPERIIELCKLALVSRPGYHNSDALDRFIQRFPQAGPRITLVNVPRIEVSSTEVRRRASLGISFKYLVLEPVERYILEQGLYR